MSSDTPWHVPGKWHAVPAWWEPELQDQLPNLPKEVGLIDCTMAEGPDAVGCHLSWQSRVEIAEKLDEAGVGAITTPGGCSKQEVIDWIKTVKKRGVKAQIVNKVVGFRPPLRPGWKEPIDKFIDMGGDVFEVHSFWGWSEMVSDFSEGVSKEQVIDAIGEAIPYAKSKGVHVNYAHGDQLRHRLSTTLSFYKAAIDAGADSIYLWDSRGNCNPLAAYHLVSKFKEIAGDRPFYIQFHNDTGMATANSFAAATAGATVLDCSVLGIGDRGGCVALEEIACALEMYGIKTGVKLEKLYELGKFVEQAFGVETQIWKPIVGRGAFMENGWGHGGPDVPSETFSGIGAEVVGRERFKSMLGGNIFSPRHQGFWTDMLDIWGYEFTEKDLDAIKERTRDAIISRRGSIEIDEFKVICEGVLGS